MDLDPGKEPLNNMDLVEPKSSLPLQNSYAAKKTVAQGMMDMALLMANANQLRFVLEYCASTRTYGFIIFLIAASLILQIVVGISLIFKGRCDLSGDSKLQQANRINNFTLAAVFLITVINIFITAFTSTPNPPQAALAQQPPPQTP